MTMVKGKREIVSSMYGQLGLPLCTNSQQSLHFNNSISFVQYHHPRLSDIAS
jgi:hypothetical protein